MVGSSECGALSSIVIYPATYPKTKQWTTALRLQLTSAGLRNKLDDFKPFSDVYSAKTIGLNILRAGIVVYAKEMTDLQMYLEKGNDIAKYDSQKAVKRAVKDFTPLIIKNNSVVIIKKCYEIACSYAFPIELVDKMTKDLYLSSVRKYNRYHLSMAMLTKTFNTSLYSNFLMYDRFSLMIAFMIF